MMTATVCPSMEQLKALSLGQLPDEQSDDLFLHIRDCDTCKAELETVSDQEDSLIADLRSPDEFAQLAAEPAYPIAMSRALEVMPWLSTFPDRAVSEWTRLPRKIGEYEIVRQLGRGGMGCVFLAQHTKLGRQVALKILVSHRLADARLRERFEAEMRAVGRLSHPNIVTAYDAREVDGTAVLVTEFIDGLDLGALIQRTGPLTMADACELTRQVAVALRYTCEQGFVHRDIKPSNIMLSRAGEVKLLDLGLARLQYGPHASDDGQPADITGTGQAMGTADYIAPEQVTDSRSVDIRADIYALGCTLFKLLTGHAPFADSEHVTAFAKMTAHVSKQPPSLTEFLPDAPAGLVKLLGSMLAKSPADRPSPPQLVMDQLSAFTVGCDLQQLAQRVESLAPVQPPALPASLPSGRARNQTFWKRPIRKSVAVAAGFLGALVGFCLGIMITITNPDGTQTIIELASGSKVQVSESEARPLSPESRSQLFQKNTTKWSAYDEAKLQDVRRSGRPVVLFITARWDIRGKAVKQLLESDAIARLIDENGVVAMEADWTEPSEAIRQKLEEFGAPGLPVVAFYPADLQARATVFKDNLTELEVLLVALQQTLAKTPAKLQVDKPARNSQSEPLQFGLLVNRQDSKIEPKIDDLTLQQMTELLHKSDSSRVIHFDNFQFASISQEDENNFPIVVWNNGWPYTLVSTDSRYAISWDEIRGRILHLNAESPNDGESTSVSLTFDATLGEQMQQLSKNAIGQQLAVIVDNRILAAPKINSAMDTSVVITGMFSQSQLGRLQLGLASAQVASAAEVATSPLVSQTRLDAAHSYWRSMGNLDRIGLAIQNFEAAMKQLPGSTNMARAWGLPPSGRTMVPCSWRVGLLPYLEETELCEQYHFDEPWDSEHNLTLLDKMPSVYRSPYAAADQPLGNTNILGFVGDKSALGENGVKLEELLDGPTSTLLFVETKHSVPWTKPEDLEFTRVEDAKQAIPFDGQGLSFLFVNGGPVSLPQPIDWDYLGKLITREADVSMPSGSPRHMEQLPSAGRPHQKTILLPSPAVLVPLQFGLFVSLAPQQKPEERRIYDLRPFEIEGLTIAKLIKLFRTSPIGAIQVDSFQFACMNEFFKIPPGLQVSKNNVTYMLVSTDPRCAIGWEEINGRILNLKIERQADDRSRTLSLTFDAILGEKMRSLTENAIGQRLAVISYNRVLAAPKIDSTFSSSLVITGAFSEAQLEPLQLALASAQVASATEVATSPPLPGSTHTTNQETSISGTITMNGKPLAEVWIVFLTNAGGRPIAARTDDRGGYVVTDRDVSPGQYQVKITTGTDDYRDADGNLMAGRQETIPARYNQESTLTVEIKGQAGNVLDFNLSSD